MDCPTADATVGVIFFIKWNPGVPCCLGRVFSPQTALLCLVSIACCQQIQSPKVFPHSAAGPVKEKLKAGRDECLLTTRC